jgi:hypothetical protein
MTVQQVGHYAPGEIEYLVEHDGDVLLEVDDFSFEFDAKMSPGGAGLGRLKNYYHKRTDAPEGSWSMSRKALSRADNGQLFMDLLKGSAYILTEYVDAAASSHTTAETLVSIIHVRTRSGGVYWEEGVDYTVNYATDTITFVSTVPSGGLEVKYITTEAHLAAQNMIQNGGFEEALTNIWEAVGAGCTVSQDASNYYVGDYGLKVDVSAQNDGCKHIEDIVVVPGRTYRLRCWIKGTSGDTFKAQWTDSSGTADMTLVSPSGGQLSGSAWTEFNWIFTPDEETVQDVRIINTKATPSDFYVDEVYLGENEPVINPLDGQHYPFTFNVIGRRVVDGVTVFKLKGCAVYSLGLKSGEAYTESISGQFLDAEFEE